MSSEEEMKGSTYATPDENPFAVRTFGILREAKAGVEGLNLMEVSQDCTAISMESPPWHKGWEYLLLGER